MTARRRILAVAVANVLLAGCTVGPDFRPPAPPSVDRYLPTALPAQTAGAPAAGEPAQRFTLGAAVEARWWRMFGSPVLDALEDEALKHNADLAAANAALRQAQELLLAQRATRFPTIDFAGSGARQKNSYALASPLSSNDQSYSLFAGQFNIAYALDVFGLQRRQTEAVAAQTDVQRFQVEAAYLALTSNVANVVLQIAGLNAQLAAARDNAAAYRQMLDLTRRMQALGEISMTDVAAAETALAQADQAPPPLQKQIGQLNDVLAVYLGRTPAELEAVRLDLADVRLPSDLPVSLPSDLVRQRPDVQAAEASLHAASAQVGVATAARLPSFALSGSLGGTSTALSQLVSNGNGFWSVGGSGAYSVFDAGALRHQQKAAEAAFAQAQEQYRATVLGAFQNTADVLQAIVYDAEALRLAAAAAQAAERSSTLARIQFEHGEANALTALNAEAARRQAQLALVQARGARFSDTVALLQALGGGWRATPEAKEAAR